MKQKNNQGGLLRIESFFKVFLYEKKPNAGDLSTE